jgi:hypothetical protein
MLTILFIVGRTTLFTPVDINLEQVLNFYACNARKRATWLHFHFALKNSCNVIEMSHVDVVTSEIFGYSYDILKFRVVQYHLFVIDSSQHKIYFPLKDVLWTILGIFLVNSLNVAYFSLTTIQYMQNSVIHAKFEVWNWSLIVFRQFLHGAVPRSHFEWQRRTALVEWTRGPDQFRTKGPLQFRPRGL